MARIFEELVPGLCEEIVFVECAPTWIIWELEWAVGDGGHTDGYGLGVVGELVEPDDLAVAW